MQQAATITSGKTIVAGLGKTGISCARYLRYCGIEFSVVDSRLNPPALQEFQTEFPDVAVELGSFNPVTLVAAAELIVSPGISLQEPAIVAARERGVSVCGDIDIFSREVSSPIIAVTGSNGKSTVVSLVGEMARSCAVAVGIGGNLDGPQAMPALDLLRQEKRALYVLELSSFQLETTRQLNAEVAVVLNLSEDHRDRYASMQEYQQAKHRIFRGCRNFVVNRDDAASAPAQALEARPWSFGLDAPASGEFGILFEGATEYFAFGSEKLLAVSEMKLNGRHNVSNALAALALGHAAGLPFAPMLQALREFPGLPHRCQWIRHLAGIDFYNDSKGTNPGATVVAISSIGEAVAGAVVLIAGGLGKDADFTPLHAVVMQYVRTVVLIGRDAQKLAQVLSGITEILFATDMHDAVQQAFARAESGDAILLSPACASMDMFTDFTHRGRVFTAAVEAL
jgi:UDP-N-acetylmuramoylalanine--D-glutamate ligase